MDTTEKVLLGVAGAATVGSIVVLLTRKSSSPFVLSTSVTSIPQTGATIDFSGNLGSLPTSTSLYVFVNQVLTPTEITTNLDGIFTFGLNFLPNNTGQTETFNIFVSTTQTGY